MYVCMYFNSSSVSYFKILCDAIFLRISKLFCPPNMWPYFQCLSAEWLVPSNGVRWTSIHHNLIFILITLTMLSAVTNVCYCNYILTEIKLTDSLLSLSRANCFIVFLQSKNPITSIFYIQIHKTHHVHMTSREIRAFDEIEKWFEHHFWWKCDKQLFYFSLLWLFYCSWAFLV